MLVNPAPPSRSSALLVQQAVQALRSGRSVAVEGSSGQVRFIAAEAARHTINCWPEAAARVVLSGQRVSVLGVSTDPETAWSIDLEPNTPLAVLSALFDPTTPGDDFAIRALALRAARADELHLGAIELCKFAGLLPAAVVLRSGAHAIDLPLAAIGSYRQIEALSLTPVGEAGLPLDGAENARIMAFRPTDGGPEQLAILIGKPEAIEAPLCRLHSECFTGDLLGSLRCDCGDQLRGAIHRMAEEGAGVLLYLAQEGRGIGLTNKLRAYALQDDGLDTVEANAYLGFKPDERYFLAAAGMLKHIGITHVRLLTNNPTKIEQLAAFGIDVVERVSHVFEANSHNRAYLLTKALRSGHLIEVDQALTTPSARAAARIIVRSEPKAR
jgi:GTP cyclohydrolase II